MSNSNNKQQIQLYFDSAHLWTSNDIIRHLFSKQDTTYVFMEYEIPTSKFSDFVRLRKWDLFIICSSITMNQTVCQYTNSVEGPTSGESRFHSWCGQCFLLRVHAGGKSAGRVTKHSPRQEGDGFNASLVPESLPSLRCNCGNAASTHNAALHTVMWRNMLCSEAFLNLAKCGTSLDVGWCVAPCGLSDRRPSAAGETLEQHVLKTSRIFQSGLL